VNTKKAMPGDPSRHRMYRIRVEGHLKSYWSDWFEGLVISTEEDGDTSLCGPVRDQAALYGLLAKVRDLGLNLVSVARIEDDNETGCVVEGNNEV
jgi:hypothetical protein